MSKNVCKLKKNDQLTFHRRVTRERLEAETVCGVSRRNAPVLVNMSGKKRRDFVTLNLIQPLLSYPSSTPPQSEQSTSPTAYLDKLTFDLGSVSAADTAPLLNKQ